MKTIQDRYAKLKVTDPARQKMNTELMELYRQKGVNPASGCVPMLLTFPVLLAFYSLLSEAIELRGAPFMLWIHDLAAPDPYYVTPILMGASQVLQQKMMPMTGARSGAAEDDAVHAGAIHLSLHHVAGGSRALLAREQRARHRAAVADQQAHRAVQR